MFCGKGSDFGEGAAGRIAPLTGEKRVRVRRPVIRARGWELGPNWGQTGALLVLPGGNPVLPRANLVLSQAHWVLSRANPVLSGAQFP